MKSKRNTQQIKSQFEDEVGLKFYNLVIVGIKSFNKQGAIFICQCECGHKNCKKEIEVQRNKLINGKVKSCGAWYFDREDLTNKVFGSLIVKEKSDVSKKWICECNCGLEGCKGTVLQERSTLTSGRVKTCGVGSPRFKDDIKPGMKFGRLTVLRLGDKSEDGHKLWVCECSCDNKEYITKASYLRSGTSSCGCLQRESVVKTMFRGGKNQVWYDDYADKLEKYETIRRDPENPDILQVKCLYCGRFLTPTRKQIFRRLYAIEGRNEYSSPDSASENRFYCNDRDCRNHCPIYKRYKYTPGVNADHSREVQSSLRLLVFKRDDWTCQRCGSHDSLQCHHMEGIMQNPIESADIDLCTTVCSDCHKWIHSQDGCKYYDLRCN